MHINKQQAFNIADFISTLIFNESYTEIQSLQLSKTHMLYLFDYFRIIIVIYESYKFYISRL